MDKRFIAFGCEGSSVFCLKWPAEMKMPKPWDGIESRPTADSKALEALRGRLTGLERVTA